MEKVNIQRVGLVHFVNNSPKKQVPLHHFLWMQPWVPQSCCCSNQMMWWQQQEGERTFSNMTTTVMPCGSSTILEEAMRRSSNLSTREWCGGSSSKVVCAQSLVSESQIFAEREHMYEDGTISNMLRKHLNYSKKEWMAIWDGWAEKAINKTENELKNALAHSVQIMSCNVSSWYGIGCNKAKT